MVHPCCVVPSLLAVALLSQESVHMHAPWINPTPSCTPCRTVFLDLSRTSHGKLEHHWMWVVWRWRSYKSSFERRMGSSTIAVCYKTIAVVGLVSHREQTHGKFDSCQKGLNRTALTNPFCILHHLCNCSKTHLHNTSMQSGYSFARCNMNS